MIQILESLILAQDERFACCVCAFNILAFFRNSRLLNSKEFFLQNFLKKISGSFYRCLIFKVRLTLFVSEAPKAILTHPFDFVKNFFHIFRTFFQSSLCGPLKFVVFTPLSRVLRYNTKHFPVCQAFFSSFFNFFSYFFPPATFSVFSKKSSNMLGDSNG